MIKASDKRTMRRKRKCRIRKKVFGTADRPRLTVFRSLRHVYAQLVDDREGRTVAAAATVEKAVRGNHRAHGNIAAAREVGRLIAARARAKDIERVVFDRSGYRFHGVVKAVADAAREGGLAF